MEGLGACPLEGASAKTVLSSVWWWVTRLSGSQAEATQLSSGPALGGPAPGGPAPGGAEVSGLVLTTFLR